MIFSRKILISDLIIDSSIGILEKEIKNKQPIKIEAKIELTSSYTIMDDIEQVVDYRSIVEIITKVATSKHFGLIEALSYKIATNLLESLSEIISIKLTISKFNVFNNCKSISIEEEYNR
ncbi:dihydroneopterin aldolase [Candidatus Kinetoplastibacterium blastocrithidii TCC012E]|uniref:dihydroneopterin aldolase n=1 Tax=Candidatus Kinetoplastidibacterium blastocrithidiae TCC012E TaxID=1208922 RepID=M1LAH0_9PROT|nr:dihydroneopterin aldolase [Candidatus Kinetoplastibacterium blastocrithidii]AFZ83400.1 dihydroneopterin aldolase [Candidatus Kinetoplastibacterium blastocrithidii (ex Strigomonas culicis)]AGF49498.1 dihydroneopterin aldolase [Candidatus Kinetoplastibacterium blastocrithidii TCC012E]